MGNIIIGQSGGPTAAINASLAGAYCEGVKYPDTKVYGMIGGIKGLLDGKYIDLSEYLKTEKDIEILKQTPSSALGSCRYKLPDMAEDKAVYEKLFDLFAELDIKHFIYIGGNDSMDTVAKLSVYAKEINSDISFMGVPKTVDNDLAVTDHTPGFGSAAKYIATTVKEIICDSSVYDIKSITVIEIMGRNAGWLTAASVLAKGEDCCGVDMIYLPERSFDLEKCVQKTRELLEKKNTVVIAVSEALRDKNGDYVASSGSVHAGLDAFGHKIMSGMGQFLAKHLGESLGVKARGIEINTPQRCAAHLLSKQDIDESFDAGAMAVAASKNNRTAEMAVIIRESDNPYSYRIETADIECCANLEKTIPQEWIINDGTYVSDEFIKYCRPLIYGEVTPILKDGLPIHMKLK